jgi:hypothetical protein
LNIIRPRLGFEILCRMIYILLSICCSDIITQAHQP